MRQFLIPDSQRRSLSELDDRLDLSTGDTRAKRSGFWVMLALSALIAVAGIITDSTATVIGAMIIAPLSTPILGIGLGIVSGRGRLIARSLLLVLAGLAMVVALGYLFAMVLPNPTSVLTNSQVTGRTAPNLGDLLAALATGLAGSIAITRRDVGDVLPGVAIAISLVPPLAVVGVCLGSGAPGLALGALVLFASNVIAMVITATIVLTVAGYAREAGAAAARHRRVYAVLGVALLVVAIPMVVNTLSSLWAGMVRDAAQVWLEQVPKASVGDVTWQSDTVLVEVLGPAALPPASLLQDAVNATVPGAPKVVVQHIVGERLIADD